MAAIVGFIVVHVSLAVLVPQSLVAMITGGPALKDEAASNGSIVPEMKTPR
jgi:hypothetical protein